MMIGRIVGTTSAGEDASILTEKNGEISVVWDKTTEIQKFRNRVSFDYWTHKNGFVESVEIFEEGTCTLSE